MSERGKGYYQKKLEYIKEFNKKNYTTICLKFNKDGERDLLDEINSKENKQGYIKDLIRDDINRAK